MKEKIKQLKIEKNAQILAHYYAPAESQEVADYVGDSFYLAKKAKDEAKPLPRMYLWCGTEDSLLSHTERMRDCLLSLGYPLRHSLTQGNHSWPYWDEQSEKAISYFTEQ